MEQDIPPFFSPQDRSLSTVETAIPVFIGYTQKARRLIKGGSRTPQVAITSLAEYEQHFGKAQPEQGIQVTVSDGQIRILPTQSISPVYKMHYALQAYFANGGGRCYVISVGMYRQPGFITLADLQAGLELTRSITDITLLIFPDAPSLPTAVDYYTLYNEALQQSAAIDNRFVIMDVWGKGNMNNAITELRSNLTNDIMLLRNGAAYYPDLEMNIPCQYKEDEVQVAMKEEHNSLTQLRAINPTLYNQIKVALQARLKIILPPSPSIAGIYTQIDRTRGIWKAPANVEVALAIKPVIAINELQQGTLNVDAATGKSVNVIRTFTGRGILVWGARTLAGNDNEWRYISVRRFFRWVETALKQATAAFVFEPNDANTWIKVRNTVNDFLIEQWRSGGLQGANPAQAFYVKVGLAQTMTALDVLEGRMIIEIGMAPIRPAEFIILRIVHQMN